MPVVSKLQRVADDDPMRCQSTFAGGQCPYKRLDGSEYCCMHGGNKAINAAQKRSVHDYRLQQWQERVDELAGSQHVKNLRGEIGILRMTLESILNQVKGPAQFPLFADKIGSTVREIKGLVEVCQKIEERNKELLSKTEVFNIADAVINLMSKFISDPDDLLAAGEELYGIITSVASGEDKSGSK